MHLTPKPEEVMRMILYAIVGAALWKFWQESMERERSGIIGIPESDEIDPSSDAALSQG